MLKDSKINFKTKLKLMSAKPNLSPLIDIALVSLMFFMITNSFVQVSGIEVDLTKNSNKDFTKSVEKFIITIDKFSNFYMNDKAIKDINAVKDELVEVKSQHNPKTIVLRADNQTDFGLITELMIIIKELKMNVFIATISHEEVNSSIKNEYEED